MNGGAVEGPDLTEARWRTSSHSAQGEACVEVASAPGWVGVRDSKDWSGPALVFPRAGWASFLNAAKGITFDLP